jgi:hypothetical protein
MIANKWMVWGKTHIDYMQLIAIHSNNDRMITEPFVYKKR